MGYVEWIGISIRVNPEIRETCLLIVVVIYDPFWWSELQAFANLTTTRWQFWYKNGNSRGSKHGKSVKLR